MKKPAPILVMLLCFHWPLDCHAQDAVNEHLHRAQQLVQSGELTQANTLLSELTHRQPGNPEALLALGNVQVQQGLFDDAMGSYESVLAISPQSEPARTGEVAAAERAALADRNAGVDGSALLCLVRARKFVSDSPQLLFDFGVQAESMRIFADAETALARAHELDPPNAKILYALAHVQLDEQKMPEAEANLRAYLKTVPEDPTAHFGLGRLLRMVERNDEARRELVESIRLQPNQTGSYYELGELALRIDDYDEAKKQFQLALQFGPQHAGALTGMGIVAYRAKEYGTAESWLKSALRFAPDYGTAHHYYALVLARLGRSEESRRQAQIAAELDKKDVQTRRGNMLTVLP